MTSYKMIVDPEHSDKVLESFQNYSWSKNTIEKPDHSYSHIPDATRYAIMHLTGNNLGKYCVNGIETDYNHSSELYNFS